MSEHWLSALVVMAVLLAAGFAKALIFRKYNRTLREIKDSLERRS